MKVLVVDDDRNTVDVILKSINWEKLCISETFYAYEIASAKSVLQQSIIDIVICDIEMPMGTGIDLIVWARKQEIKSEFLFLTCHECFKFVSYAIQYQAAAYLIKPFEPQKMELELIKLVSRIEKNKKLEDSAKYKDMWINSRTYLESSFWEDLLTGIISSSKDNIQKELHKRKLSIDVNETWVLVLVCSSKSGSAWEEWDEETLEYALLKLAGEVLREEIETISLIHENRDNNFYMFDILPEKDAVKEKTEELVHLCDSWLDCEITCYISNPCNIIQLPNIKNTMVELDTDNLINRGKVLPEECWISLLPKDKPIINLDAIEEKLALGDQIGILNELKNIMERLVERNSMNVLALQTIQMNLTQVIDVYLYKNGVSADELFSDTLTLKLRHNATNSVVDMLKWQSHIIRKTIEYTREVQKSDNILQKVKLYIQEHFREEIGRNEVAKEVYLNPEYLAKLFKKDMGISLKDYIHQLRIKEAKFLLAGGARVSDVAGQIGFDNFSYFSTVFKRVTGLSPNEYKRLEKGTEDES